MKKNNQQDLEQQGMDYLQSIPRRWVTIYIPLGIFVFVLLFPFYWMAMTAFKPNEEMLSSANPFWVIAPTDRESVVWGTSLSVRVDPGGRSIIKKKNIPDIAHQKT